MSCGCSFQKKKTNNDNIPSVEKYHQSPSFQENYGIELFDKEEERKENFSFQKNCKKKGEGNNFIYMEPGYRQATKCPCPYEYPSYHCPKIPFI